MWMEVQAKFSRMVKDLKYNSSRNCAVVKVLERLELSCSMQRALTQGRIAFQ